MSIKDFLGGGLTALSLSLAFGLAYFASTPQVLHGASAYVLGGAGNTYCKPMPSIQNGCAVSSDLPACQTAMPTCIDYPGTPNGTYCLEKDNTCAQGCGAEGSECQLPK
jgi:hypothetical protein